MAEYQSKELTDNPLMDQLISLHQELREGIAKRWARSLPLAEELLDRWERARHLGFGEGASIYDSAIVLGEVTVGEQTWIGPSTILDGSGGLAIGAFCSISAGVQIYSHDSVAWAVTRGKAKLQKGATKIEDCCYIGPNTVISRGVSVGEGSIIGAHSFLSESIPSGSFAVGVPARVRGKVRLDGDQVKIDPSEPV